MTSPPAKQAPVHNLPIQPAARRAATAGYYASFILFGLLAAALGPTLPGLARNTGTELAQISFVFTAQALGYLMGSVYGGYLFDHLPGHRLLFGVLVGMGIMAFFVPLISLLWLLVLVFIFLGAMQGSLEVGNNTLLVWLYKDGVGPYINALHFFFGVGAVLAPIIIARTTSSSGDFYWVYWALSLVAIPVAVWLGRLPSPTNPQLSQPGQSTRANPILVTLVAVLLFLYVGAEVSYGGWIYTYTINQFEGHPAASAALLTSAFWGALTLGRLVSIPMAARVKPATILVVDLSGLSGKPGDHHGLALLDGCDLGWHFEPGILHGSFLSDNSHISRAEDADHRACERLVLCRGRGGRDDTALVDWAIVRSDRSGNHDYVYYGRSADHAGCAGGVPFPVFATCGQPGGSILTPECLFDIGKVKLHA